MLNEEQAELLRDPAPEDSHGCYGADADGGRKRMVYPIFGSDNVHHFFGRRFEAARAGGSGEIKVGRVLDHDALFLQILLWTEIAHYRHPDTGEDRDGQTAMGIWPDHFPVAMEVRTACLDEWDPRTGDMNLLNGEVIRPHFPADALSIPKGEDIWLPLLDEAVDVESRTFRPQPLQEFRYILAQQPAVKYWVLGPPLDDGHGIVPEIGTFHNVGTLPLDVQGVSVAWIATCENGEDPLVVTREQLHQLRDGTASDALRNVARNTASHVHAYRKSLAEGVPVSDALAQHYGLQSKCRISLYRTDAPSKAFAISGRNADVSQARPSSAATDADIREDANR